MIIAHGVSALRRDPAPRRASGVVNGLRGVFQEWRRRERVRSELSALSNRELFDIGTTRGEIDYVAANRATDPRDIRTNLGHA